MTYDVQTSEIAHRRGRPRSPVDRMIEQYALQTHDILVIGAGGAGLRAAVEATAMGANVGVVSKSLLGKAHTVMAEGGIAAALGNLDAADNWQIHFQDTMRGGQMINNWRMAELHAKESPDRVYELESWGAIFDRTPDGKILQRPFGAHTYRRLCHVGDRTGLELLRIVQDQAVAMGITVHMETTVTRLLKDGDRIAGAVAYRRDTVDFVVFSCKAIILATGGWGRLFKVTSNSWECTGDGVAMGYEAGAEILDPEMVQFHPTGMVWPPGVRGLLVTEAVRGDGGFLANREGKRFMLEYDPVKKDLASRDVGARSIYEEVQAGRGTEHGGVYLDVRHLGAETIKRKLPSMYEQFRQLADVNITREPMEVAPTIHYAMGGLKVSADDGALSRVSTPRARRRQACMAQTAWVAIPSLISSSSGVGRGPALPPTSATWHGAGSTSSKSRRSSGCCYGLCSTPERRTRISSNRSCNRSCRTAPGSPARRRGSTSASPRSWHYASGPNSSTSQGPAASTRAGTPLAIFTSC